VVVLDAAVGYYGGGGGGGSYGDFGLSRRPRGGRGSRGSRGSGGRGRGRGRGRGGRRDGGEVTTASLDAEMDDWQSNRGGAATTAASSSVNPTAAGQPSLPAAEGKQMEDS